MSPPEPRNPFYVLLLIASLLFVVTALTWGVVPLLQERAVEAGQAPAPVPFHGALDADAWTWLLYAEVAAMVVFALLSMGLDRLRSLKKTRSAGTIPPSQDSPSTS